MGYGKCPLLLVRQTMPRASRLCAVLAYSVEWWAIFLIKKKKITHTCINWLLPKEPTMFRTEMCENRLRMHIQWETLKSWSHLEAWG